MSCKSYFEKNLPCKLPIQLTERSTMMQRGYKKHFTADKCLADLRGQLLLIMAATCARTPALFRLLSAPRHVITH